MTPQAITLRLITRQAGGGEIVRTRRIEAAQALIGRAPACDIHLPDLAVDPEHAMLRIAGDGRVSLESLTGAPFTVDGKPTLRTELQVGRAPTVSFGDYDLILSQGSEDDVAVTVVRRPADHAPGAGVFSLRAA